MAAAGAHLISEDHFLCSICVDVFTDPVSTPCGHNFCNKCITKYWDISVQFNCPMCNEVFTTRPQLKVNAMFYEMVAQFRCEAQQVTKNPGEVLCDACTGTKAKAVKSCLECLTSYCETHMETHLTAPRLRRHQLIEPVENLEDRVCKKHEQPLVLFCRTDQFCVCSLCPILDHKDHEFVPLKEGYEEKKVELKTTEAEVQQMIQERRVKIEEIKHSVKMSQGDADREKADGVEVFTALKESVDRGLDQFLKDIKDKQTAAEKQAEDLITELEEEISELMKRSTEMEQFSLSGDHIHLLQSFSSLKAAPPTKDWTEVRVRSQLYEGTVVRAVEKLEEMLHGQMKKLKLKNIQQFAVDLTLDPDTAHPKLILSEDRKQVYCGDVEKKLPENPQRFSHWLSVLGKQSFSSGRFYFEVQVKGKTEWYLGVVRESIQSMGTVSHRPYNGAWTIKLSTTKYMVPSLDASVHLSVSSPPEKVGVFVDYDEGLVSFYDADAGDRIYSYSGCSFTNKLRPYFNPCPNYGRSNCAPLIICPVNQTA